MLKEWISVLKGKKATFEEKRRAEICVKCPDSEHANFLDYVKGDIKEVKGLYCNKCKCPLVAKLKTNDKNHICKLWI